MSKILTFKALRGIVKDTLLRKVTFYRQPVVKQPSRQGFLPDVTQGQSSLTYLRIPCIMDDTGDTGALGECH